MKVCQVLCDVAGDHGVRRIGRAAAQTGLARATEELAPLFESGLRGLDALPHTRKLLLRLARGETAYPPGANPIQLKGALDELMANGLIRRVIRGQYVLHERLFQQYLAGQWAPAYRRGSAARSACAAHSQSSASGSRRSSPVRRIWALAKSQSAK